MIVIDAISAREGGGRTYINNLITCMPSNADDQVIIFVLPEWNELKTKFPRANIWYVPQCLTNPFIRALWQKFVFPRLLNKLKATVLFVPGGVTSTRRLGGCKFVTMSRNILPFDEVARRGYPLGWQRLRNSILRYVMESTLKRADLVIFLSEYAYRKINEKIGGGIKNKLIIPHGISKNFYTLTKKDRLDNIFCDNGKYLLYVSTIDFYKAQCEVVDEFAEYISKTDHNEKLVFVGSANPDYLKKLLLRIQKHKINDRVEIAGKVEHELLPALYSNSRAIIFASLAENCPNVLLESMASGRPVFCSSAQPMPEFGGEGVIYFDPLVPHDLSCRLSEVLNNPVTYNEWSVRAFGRSRLYDWNASTRSTWDAILGWVS